MKKISIIIIVIVIFIIIFNQIAFAEGLDGWSMYKEINIDGSGKYKALYLDEDIYKNAQDRLNDLRLVNDKGEFVPYYILDGYSYRMENKISYSTQEINSFTKDNNLYVDFKATPSKENSDILGRSLVFKTSNQSFAKKIDIYGSYEGVDWKFVKTDTLYNIDGYKKLEIDMDTIQKYTFYRIRIPNNLEGIKIDNLQINGKFIEKSYENYSKTKELQYKVETQDKRSMVKISNPYKLKIKELRFDIKGNFKRMYSVKVDKNGNYASLGLSGELYSLNFKDINVENKSIEFVDGVNYDDLIIEIANKDDKPLEIEKMYMSYSVDKLVFENEGNTSLKLYFGNPNASKPSYDVESYKMHIEKDEQDLCSFGGLTTVEVKKDEPKVKWNYVFNGIVALTAILMIFILVRKMNLFKKT